MFKVSNFFELLYLLNSKKPIRLSQDEFLVHRYGKTYPEHSILAVFTRLIGNSALLETLPRKASGKLIFRHKL